MDADSRVVRDWKHIVRDPVAWVLISPALWSAMYWLFVLAAATVNGGWPHARSGYPGMASFDHPSVDPKQLGLFYGIVAVSLFALPVLVAIGAGVSLLSVGVRSLRRPRAAHVSFLLGSVLAYATVGMDLGGSFRWFID